MDESAILKFNSIMESLGDPLTKIEETSGKVTLFIGCPQIPELKIPEGVEYIHKSPQTKTYERTSLLERINIPKTCSVIGEQAFGYCINLGGNIQADNVKIIDTGAFRLTKIEELITPSLMAIRNRALEGCSRLKNIKCSDRLWVGKDAFNGCSSLEKIKGKIYMAIGAKPFSTCDELKEISLCDASTFNEREYSLELSKLGIVYLGNRNYTHSNILDSCYKLKRVDVGDLQSMSRLGLPSYDPSAAVLEELVGLKLTELYLNNIMQPGMKDGHTHIVLGDIKEIILNDDDVFGFDILFTKDAYVKFEDRTHGYRRAITIKAGQTIGEEYIKGLFKPKLLGDIISE